MATNEANSDLRIIYPNFLEHIAPELGFGTTDKDVLRPMENAHIWPRWAVSVLSGDEPVVPPDLAQRPLQTNKAASKLFAGNAELDGRTIVDFQTGAMARILDAIYARKDAASASRFTRVSKMLALFTYAVGNDIGFRSEAWQRVMPLIPQTILNRGQDGQLAIKFSAMPEYSYPIAGSSASVINLGPGLTGARFATALMGHTNKLHMISGGKGAQFVNEWNAVNLNFVQKHIDDDRLHGRLKTKLPRGMSPDEAVLPNVTHYTKGMAETLGKLSTALTTDVVVMSAVHAAGPFECQTGIRSAQKALTPGGLLVIKAPPESSRDIGGMDRLAPLASKLLGTPVDQGECGTDVFAIYQKPE